MGRAIICPTCKKTNIMSAGISAPTPENGGNGAATATMAKHKAMAPNPTMSEVAAERRCAQAASGICSVNTKTLANTNIHPKADWEPVARSNSMGRSRYCWL